MKKTTMWKVSWPKDDKGLSQKEIHVTREYDAKIACTWPVGYCGYTGSYEKYVIWEAEDLADAKMLLEMKFV
jgi:hypothetical protein